MYSPMSMRSAGKMFFLHHSQRKGMVTTECLRQGEDRVMNVRRREDPGDRLQRQGFVRPYFLRKEQQLAGA
jgi:hypothetical protein